MRLVELADEYGLTTTDAMDLCAAVGVPAEGSASELTDEQASRWRQAATEREIEIVPDPVEPPPPDDDFGPLPLAPWEQSRDHVADARPALPPRAGAYRSDLGPGWGADVGDRADGPQVSLYAATSLALGVVSLIFPLVPAVLAVPISVFAKRQIARSHGRLTGERLATAAQVLSAIGIVLWTVLFFVGIYRPGGQ